MTELSSEKGIDYTRLESFLKAQKWLAGDKETLKVMLQAANREAQGNLNNDSIKNFPCTDLRIIDKLWVRYSNGYFGFSVQKRIWEKNRENYRRWCELVGWCSTYPDEYGLDDYSWLDYPYQISRLTLGRARKGLLPMGPGISFRTTLWGDRTLSWDERGTRVLGPDAGNNYLKRKYFFSRVSTCGL